MDDVTRHKIDWAFEAATRNLAMTISLAILMPYALNGRRPTAGEIVADCERYEAVGPDVMAVARSQALDLLRVAELETRRQ